MPLLVRSVLQLRAMLRLRWGHVLIGAIGGRLMVAVVASLFVLRVQQMVRSIISHQLLIVAILIVLLRIVILKRRLIG
jgi:hypothetical protein